MIDARMLHHDFDEEDQGFSRPPRRRRPSHGTPVGRLALAGVALAILVLALAAVTDGSWDQPVALVTAWTVLAAGTAVYFWDRYRTQPEGIRHDGVFFDHISARGLSAWLLGVGLTGFYVLLYWFPEQLSSVIDLVDPVARGLTGQPADQWFLYGFLYTLAVVVFGVRMFGKYRHSRYHRIRTASVMFFQLGFAFLLPQILKAFNEPEFYFTYFWPLKPEYLWPAGAGMGWILDAGRLGVFMIFWGAIATFVLTPILTYRYGKRWYCSWVCGCGGLAETMGDPFRQLSSKSTLSWKAERMIIYPVLVLVTVTTVALWIDFATEGGVFGALSSSLRQWYGFYIGALFAGVIGVGFYPILGSRVWCRFGCPMAAILGIFQKFASRFRITTNGDQCMSCGNCSTYCEMGIDVRAYAQRGENIVRASCVGCGVCAAVCPRGVLKLENGSDVTARYPGADRPLDEFLTSLRNDPRAGRYDNESR